MNIKLSNIHEFTDQEIFDYVTEQLLIQNKRSGTYRRGLYRSSDGSKCAVGLLMDNYQTIFDYCEEHSSINGDTVWHSMPLSRILENFYRNAAPRYRLLVVLQAVHDYLEPDHWNYILPATRIALFDKKIPNVIKDYSALISRIAKYHESRD